MIPFKTRIKSGVVQRLEVIESLSFQGTEIVPGAATDEKAKVSLNDTTAGYLNGKLVAGSGIVLTENNNGGNETLTISANAVDLDVKVSVSANDTTAGYLNGKLVAGTGITFTENNNGGDETLTVTLGSHTHAASDITSGIIATARLATGTADSTTYLRGDQTWQTIASGVTGFTPAIVTGAPNAIANVSRLLSAVTTTNGDIAIEPKGAGALIAQVPDSSVPGGTKRGQYAVDFQRHRTQSDRTASGQFTFIGSGSNNGVSGNYSSVTGGQNNTATGLYSYIGGGLGSSSSAAYAFVGGGGSNNAQDQYTVVVGGQSNTITSQAQAAFIGGGQSNTIGNSSNDSLWAIICGGLTNTVISRYGTVIGGTNNYVGRLNGGSNSQGGVIIGGEWAFTNRLYQRAFAAGRFAAIGDAQTEWYDVRRLITTGTWVPLTIDGDTPNNFSNTIRIMTTSAYTFQALITAYETTVNMAAGYKIEGIITNFSGTVALLGTPVVTTFGESLAGYDVRAVADTTNGALAIEFLGSAGYSTRVHAHVTLVKTSAA